MLRLGVIARIPGLARHFRRFKVDRGRRAFGPAQIRRRSNVVGPVIDHLRGSLLAVTGRYQIRHVLLEYRFWSKPEPIR
jgi:hypothetical protein